MKKVIISVTNDLSTDQRVNKVANSLIDAGFFVLLVGVNKKKKNILEKRNYDCFRFDVFFKKGFFFYLEFNIRLFLFLILNKSDIFLSNDLDTLLANFFASKLKKTKLVYDSHELFPEVPELLNRPVVKFIWSSMEKFLLKRVKHSYTVSESIAKYYNKKYGINMSVISNFPKMDFFNGAIKKTNKNKKIIYQGAVNKDRGIELMIEAMQYVDAELYIVGEGDILGEMIQVVEKVKLKNKVFFVGKVPFHQLFQITKTADLGLSFEEDTCLAYRYSLPNKIFDYINAEIPILISNLPEFKSIIEAYPVGMVLNSRNVKNVSKQINHMLSFKKSNWIPFLLEAKKAYSWKNEEKKLLTIFR